MYSLIKAIVEKPKRLVAGCLSGTSFQSIDVSFVEIIGNGTDIQVSLRHFESIPHSTSWKAEFLMNSSKDTSSVADICRINKQLGKKIGESVLIAAKNGGISMREVDFVASAGQIMYRMPEINASLRIGELADTAAVTGKLTVGDFRSSDMAYGGLGSPIVPLIDYLLHRDAEKNHANFNIGGIGTVTILPAGCGIEDVKAFDTGPGNVLIDNLMRLHTKGDEHFDYCGSIAGSGRQSLRLSEYLADADSYVMLKPPKCTGREHYTVGFAERIMRRGIEMGLEFADILATVTNHTAYSLWYALTYLNDTAVDNIEVSGGGTKNTYLMQCLEELFPGKISTAIFSPSDAKEAMAYAVLGNEFLHGNTNNLRGATGADRRVIMGKLTLPSPL